MLAYGILQPVRLRGPITEDNFWDRVEQLQADTEHEGIELRKTMVARSTYLAIPVNRPLAVCGLYEEPVESRYAVALSDFPKQALNALGPDREKVENWWVRVTYLASLLGIILPVGQWLLINEA
jgi:hypothetical protein